MGGTVTHSRLGPDPFRCENVRKRGLWSSRPSSLLALFNIELLDCSSFNTFRSKSEIFHWVFSSLWVVSCPWLFISFHQISELPYLAVNSFWTEIIESLELWTVLNKYLVNEWRKKKNKQIFHMWFKRNNAEEIRYRSTCVILIFTCDFEQPYYSNFLPVSPWREGCRVSKPSKELLNVRYFGRQTCYLWHSNTFDDVDAHIWKALWIPLLHKVPSRTTYILSIPHVYFRRVNATKMWSWLLAFHSPPSFPSRQLPVRIQFPFGKYLSDP